MNARTHTFFQYVFVLLSLLAVVFVSLLFYCLWHIVYDLERHGFNYSLTVGARGAMKALLYGDCAIVGVWIIFLRRQNFNLIAQMNLAYATVMLALFMYTVLMQVLTILPVI